jgi:hypothetical protein
VLGYYAVAWPWLLRNKLTFGRWFLTHRAEQVLTVRAEYNKMTAKEYFLSFL